MKKIKDSLKYIKLRDLVSPFIFLLMLIPSIIFRLINKLKKRQLWLVCEEGDVAKDNGYHFFKYVRTNHPNDYCFYVIDKKSKDYNKVKDLDNIIQFRSLKHWVYYLAADYNISTQKMGNPNQVLFYILHVTLGLMKNRVFLQHGITKDDSPWLYYKNTKFKYFICGAKKEYEYIKEKFGYPEGNVIYTGFPRFDNLYNNNLKEKQILVNAFFSKDPLKPLSIKLLVIIFSFSCYFVINGFLYNEEYVSTKLKSEGNKSFLEYISDSIERILYTSIVGGVISFIIGILFNTDKKINSVINKNKNQLFLKGQIAKIYRCNTIRIICFIIIQFILMVLFIIYIFCFCFVYQNNKLDWFESSLIIITIMQSFSVFTTFLFSFFKFLSIKCQWELCFKINTYLEDNL